MSENSSTSNNSKNNIPQKKNVSYSTDYMVEYLKDSAKAPTNNKSSFKHNSDVDSDDRSNVSDLNTYLTSDNKHASLHNNHTEHTEIKSEINNTSNLFSKNFTSKTLDNTHNNEQNAQNAQNAQNNTQEENPDYDNYNELSPEQQMLKKLDMLRKLGELAQYGVMLSQNYNMNSDYFTMKYEYQLHTNIRSKQNFINWTSSIMLNCIYGLEILNEKYDPFSLKLTNWSQQINADISSYYDVFGEIYEKYNKPGKSMSPELKLILMIGGSALKFHLNQVATQGKLNMAPMFGLQNNSPNVPQNYTNLNNQPNPQVMEQLRQQAATQQLIEQTQKQNEILMSKTKNEHELANKQMKDIMFLQQKKEEQAKLEAEKIKKMQEFQKAKAFFEARNNNNQFPQPQFTNSQYTQNNMLNSQRRNDIASHLDYMKNNITNMGTGINMGLSKEELDRPAQELYKNQASNVVHRNKTNLSVNTSDNSQLYKSKSMKSSKHSDNNDTSEQSSKSEKSDKSNESSESTNVSKSNKSSQSNSTISANSDVSSSEPKKNSKVEKSLSSRNNYSTISKRKYKKSGLTVDTS